MKLVDDHVNRVHHTRYKMCKCIRYSDLGYKKSYHAKQ